MTEKGNSSKDYPLGKILITFFCIIVIRTFLDSFAYTFTGGYVFSWEHALHSVLYFSSIFLSFSLLLFFLAKESFNTVLAFLSKLSCVILLVPFVDLLINKARIHSLYVTVNNNDFFQTFLQLINPFNDLGVTKGIYFSAYITLILFFIFVYQKTHSIKRGAMAMVAGFSVFFIYSILPSLILLHDNAIQTGLQSDFTYLFTLKQSWLGRGFLLNSGNLSDISSSMNVLYEIMMARLYWLTIILQTAVILFLSNKKLWLAFIKNSRIERIANYSLIAIIGMILGQKIIGDINISNSINILTMLCFFVMIALSAWVAAFVNDNEDIAIDKISNPQRPLVNNAIDQKQWTALHKYLFVLLGLGLFIMDGQVAFLLIIAQCIFYVYSVPPLRLKRDFVSSSALMGLTTIIIAMSGFFLVSADQQLLAFPIKAMAIIGISYALLSNIKDIKDYAGDSAENIKTLPVVFGLQKSKKIIATMYALVFMGIPIALSINLLLPFALTASIFVFYLLTRRAYIEKYVFYTKFAYMILLYIVTK